MQFIGIDLGSSSVKVSVMDGESGKMLAMSSSPGSEMRIDAPRPGWAEQDPELWYRNFEIALLDCLNSENVVSEDIKAIGISYQMHGLVAVDKNKNVIRPSIIWCDSRAIDIGEKAYKSIGAEYCSTRLLNSPGNFTASKLAWLRVNEPENYKKIYKVMLPGDYIAMRLSGEINTTISGLSEGIFWDFKSDSLSTKILDHFGIDKDLIPDIVPAFSVQAYIKESIAEKFALPSGVSISYRAGDQPNNALSLNVREPGEIAATAGTSGVIYGVTDRIVPEEKFRVNLFAHVNHEPENPRLGILACINGTGIMNAWIRRLTGIESYDRMNTLAERVKPGCDGLQIFPFGNGAERLLGNIEPGASFNNIDLNLHGHEHIYRAVQESIAFSFRYAIDIMKDMGMDMGIIRAGEANMFQSPLFCKVLSSVSDLPVNLYNTDGSLGAARGAGIGIEYYSSFDLAFENLKIVSETMPDPEQAKLYEELYQKWKEKLNTSIQT